jgi:4-hydroxybenzoate polyprenyltransferase
MNLITKQHNNRDYAFLMAFAAVFALLGIYYKQGIFYIASVVMIGLAMFRRHWLHKRLK